MSNGTQSVQEDKTSIQSCNEINLPKNLEVKIAKENACDLYEVHRLCTQLELESIVNT